MPGKNSRRRSKHLGSHTHMENLEGVSGSWILAPTWPRPGSCGHLRRDPMDGRFSLSLAIWGVSQSMELSLFLPFKRKRETWAINTISQGIHYYQADGVSKQEVRTNPSCSSMDMGILTIRWKAPPTIIWDTKFRFYVQDATTIRKLNNKIHKGWSIKITIYLMTYK